MGGHGSKPPQAARVLMLGLDGAGKSTLLYKLKYNECMVTVPTVGFNVEMLETRDRQWMTVWDVGGQKGMRPHWRHYYAGTDALVFVVDSWDRRRLEEARRELHQILGSPSLRGVPLVVLANKQDLPWAASPTEITLKLDLKSEFGERHWVVQPCSAMSGVGLEEGFRRVAYLLKTPLEKAEENVKNKVKQLNTLIKMHVLCCSYC